MTKGIPKALIKRPKFEANGTKPQPMKATLSSEFAIKAKTETAVHPDVKIQPGNGKLSCTSAPVRRKFGHPIAASSPITKQCAQNESLPKSKRESLTFGTPPSKRNSDFSNIRSSGYGRQSSPNLNATRVVIERN